MSRGETQLHCSDSMPSGLTKMVITVGRHRWTVGTQILSMVSAPVRLSALDQLGTGASIASRRWASHSMTTGTAPLVLDWLVQPSTS